MGVFKLRTKIFAYITFIAIIAIVSFNTYFLDRGINTLLSKTDELNTESDDALMAAETLKSEFEKKEAFISMTVSHDDLTNIEEGISELVGALETGDKEEAAVIKSRLRSSLLHLRRLCGINIDSII